MIRRLALLVAVVTGALSLGAGVLAYWTSAGSGSATGSVGTLTAPGQPTRSGTGATVALSWSASTVTSGGTVGYHVERSTEPITTWSDACGTTVGSPTTATTCTDSPTSDTYRYRVTAIFNSWTTVSPVSDPFLVTGGDTTPPTNALSLVSQSPAGSSLLLGSTVYYRGTGSGSGGSFVIRNAVADGESGPASSATATLGGTTIGWTHLPSTVSTPAGGPYDSNTFTWTEGASSSPTEVLTGADLAGNATASPTLTFTNDSTAPTGGALAVSGQSANGIGTTGYSTSTGFTIGTRTDFTDGGSGMASSVLTVQSFVLASTGGILDGACGTASAPFASPTVVSGTTQPGGIVTERCYRYTLTGTDNLGNTTSLSTTVKVDTTAPNAPTIALSDATGSTFISGTTVFINAQAGKLGSFSASAIENDLQSGILSVEFPLLAGFSSGGGTDTTSGYSSGTYNWSGAVAASGPQTVTGTNYAGLTNSAAFTVTPDTATPINGALTVNSQVATPGGSSGYSTSTAFLIGSRANYTDPGSGLASSVLTVQSFTLASSDGSAEGTCGAASAPFAAPTVIGGTTQPGGIVTARCYTYTLTGTDNVGNTTSVSTTVKVDTTAPSAPAITLSAATGNTFINGLTVFINAQAGKSGSFSASATTADTESGISRVNFPTLAGFTAGGGDDFVPPYVTPVSYSWTGGGATPGPRTVSVPNFAGVAPATSTFTVTSDTTAPTGGVLTVNGTAASGPGTSSTTASTSFTIGTRTDYTDAGAGLATSTLTVQSATYNGTSCGAAGSGGPFTSATAVTGTTQPGGIQAGFCYVYTLAGTDNVGNAVSITTTVVVTLNYTFVVSNPGPQTAGTAFGGFTIQLQVGGSNTTSYYGTAYTGGKAITFSGPGNAPNGTPATPTYPATVTFTNGLATLPAGAVTLHKAEATTLTATDSANSIVGTSTSFTVSPTTGSALMWVTTAAGTTNACPTGSEVVGNAGSRTWFVAVVDSFGNITVNGASARAVSIAKVSGGGNAPSPAALTIPASANPAVTSGATTLSIPNGNPADTTYTASSTSPSALTTVSCIIKKNA